MRAALEYGRRYRTSVEVPPGLQRLVTPAVVVQEMERYQLFGSVVVSGARYVVTAQFRGRSGTYDLPDQVQTLEIVG